MAKECLRRALPTGGGRMSVAVRARGQPRGRSEPGGSTLPHSSINAHSPKQSGSRQMNAAAPHEPPPCCWLLPDQQQNSCSIFPLGRILRDPPVVVEAL